MRVLVTKSVYFAPSAEMQAGLCISRQVAWVG
jgi:hypothetical protein